MKITKYEHACVVLEEQGKKLVIDPGKFSESLTDLSNIVGVFVTHVHSDHFDLDNLEKIAGQNPSCVFFGPEQVAKESGSVNMQAVRTGGKAKAGNFSLEFFGGQHEFYNEFENLAVLANEAFLHPGDSYTVPSKPVKVLGLPASAPWLRVLDTVNYLKQVKPEIAVPIHNSVLSEEGKEIHYRIIEAGAQEAGINWKVVETGESIQV